MTILSDEITTDPLVRGYAAMTDQQVVDDMNAVNRSIDIAADAGALFNYLVKEKARDVAAEPAATAIYGRLKRVDEAGIAAVGAKVFGTAAGFSVLTEDGLDSCRTLLAVADGDRLASLSQVMTEQKFNNMLNDVKNTGVMKAGDVTAIKALSATTVSRGVELGIGKVYRGQVIEARAL